MPRHEVQLVALSGKEQPIVLEVSHDGLRLESTQGAVSVYKHSCRGRAPGSTAPAIAC